MTGLDFALMVLGLQAGLNGLAVASRAATRECQALGLVLFVANIVAILLVKP